MAADPRFDVAAGHTFQPLFPGAVTLSENTIPQAHCYDPVTKTWFVAQVVQSGRQLTGEGAPVSYTQRFNDGDLAISRLDANGDLTGVMFVRKFDHGVSMSCENVAGTTYLILPYDAVNPTARGRKIARMPFFDGQVIDVAQIGVLGGTTGYDPFPGTTAISPCVDLTNNRIFLRRGTVGGTVITVHDFALFKTGVFTALYSFTQPNTYGSAAVQGWCGFGNFFYQMHGFYYSVVNPRPPAGSGDAGIGVVDVRTASVVTVQPLTIAPYLEYREPEGLQVVLLNGVPTLSMSFGIGLVGQRQWVVYGTAQQVGDPAPGGTWPATPLQPRVELSLGGTWTDVTAWVRERATVTITRGRQDEASVSEPSTCQIVVDNSTGRFTPRNPAGPYYGLIGRNTPIRVSVALGGAWRTRFVGEVSAWPQTWDVSGKDVTATIEASGLGRRLQQGATPLRSAIYRQFALDPDVVAYWPMEDVAGSRSAASTSTAVAPMKASGAVVFAADESMVASSALPQMGTGKFTATVPTYPGEVSILRFVLLVPPAGLPDLTVLVRILAPQSGNAGVDRTDIVYSTSGGGTLQQARYVDGVRQDDGLFSVAVPLNGRAVSVAMSTYIVSPGAAQPSVLAVTDIETGATAHVVDIGAVVTLDNDQFTQIVLAPNGDLGTTVIGHLAVAKDLPGGFTATKAETASSGPYLNAHLGETAARRVTRLLAEEGIATHGAYELGPIDSALPDATAWTPMGPQLPATLTDLLAEAETADLGALIETRDALGYTYRPRASLYNQLPTLALAYGNLSELTPVDDDQSTRNDITVDRVNGSSARAEQTTGPLSTAAPPNGVGRYDESVGLNLAGDDQLPAQAAWRLRLGTVDETRYPTLRMDLATAAFVASPALTAAALNLDVGDLVTVTGLPAWLPPDQVRLLAQGFTETFDMYGYSITVNCTPESPWRTLQPGAAGYDRLDSSSAATTGAVTSTATTWTVTTAAGDALVVTSADRPGDFPLDLMMGGERISVGAVTGTTSPQTFSLVTRSVNGVVKAHAAGTPIRLTSPTSLAL